MKEPPNKTNPNGCPIDPMLRFFALKWLVHIVWYLGRKETLHFAELRRLLPGRVSAKVLSARLKQLEKLAIVEREVKGAKPPHVTYRLTAHGSGIHEYLMNMERQGRQLSLPEV
jgi:DNA-binding HxlR family transcriptional regulator